MKNKITLILGLLLSLSFTNVNAQNVDESPINHGIVNQQFDINQSAPLNSVKPTSKSSKGDYGNAPNLNWNGQFGGSAFDNISAVVTDTNGNIYVTGSFYDQMSLNGTTYTSTGIREAFVAKFSNTGSLVWLTQIPASTNNQTYSNDICMDASGNLFVTGYYTGPITVGSSNLPNVNGFSMFYTKLNNQGQLQNGAYHSQVINEIGLYIDVDASGNIYISVTMYQSVVSRHPSWLLKFNSSNTQVYANQYDVGFNDFVIDGNSIYYSGVIQNGDNGYIDANLTLPQPVSYNDVFIAKSDLNGVFDWGLIGTHPGNGDSMADRIDIDNSSNLYLAGRFRTSIAFGLDTINQQQGNFVAKFDTLGNAQWLKAQDASDIGLTSDNSGNVYTLSNNSIIKYSSIGSVIWNNAINIQPQTIDYSSSDKIITVGDKNGYNFVTQNSSMAVQEWTTQFGSTSAKSHVIGAVTDDDGNLYTYSYTSGSIDYFGTTVDEGIFVSKQDGMGNIKWINQFNGVFVNYGVGNYIAVDANNQNIYFTGNFTDTLNISGQPSLIPDIDGSIFILKYDASGNFKWSKKEDFEGYSLCLAPDYSNNIVLCGTFKDTISISGTTLQSAGSDDCFIVKYDINANKQWALRAGGESTEYTGFVSVDGNDNVYFLGEFTSQNVTIDATSFPMVAGEGNVLLAKFTPNGNYIWAKSFADSEHAWHDDVSWPTGIITDVDGNSYIKGNLSYKGKFDNIVLENTASYFNRFIAKIDSSGNAIWAKGIFQPVSGFSYDYNQFDIDNQGSVYFGMQAKSIWNFGTDFQFVPVSTNDLFVAKYSASGNLNWVKAMQGNNYSYSWISSIAVYDTANVFVSGFFNSFLSIDNQSMTSQIYHGFISMFGGNINGFNEVYNSNISRIDIFPNPTTEKVSFITNKAFNNASMNIYTIEGKLVKTELINSKDAVNVSSLPSGAYLIRVETMSGETFVSKFVKQ